MIETFGEESLSRYCYAIVAISTILGCDEYVLESLETLGTDTVHQIYWLLLRTLTPTTPPSLDLKRGL